jgi:hypothetical protein
VKTIGIGCLLCLGLSQAMAEEPKWLLDARAKEGTLIAPHLVTSDDKQISFEVPIALAGKLVADEKAYTANFTLGPQAGASCEILKDAFDVAAMIRETAQVTFSNIIEPGQGKIEYRGVENIDAGVAGATPFLSASWLYRVNDGKGARLGALRQYAASQAGHNVYCALNDLGYTKTFDKVAQALIQSLRTRSDEEAPYYSEVSVASMSNRRIGYDSLELRRDKDGDTKAVETNVLLIAITPDTMRAQDAIDVDWIRPDGTMINGKHVIGSNGEVEMDLALKRGEGEGWLVEGRFKGKDVKETIPSGSPSTWLSQTNMVRALLANPEPVGAQASATIWLASDPGQFTEETVKVMAAVNADTFSVRHTAGNEIVDLVVDRATGQARQGTMQLGPETLKVDRIYVQGSP